MLRSVPFDTILTNPFLFGLYVFRLLFSFNQLTKFICCTYLDLNKYTFFSLKIKQLDYNSF